jgi:hypothetical protein
MVLSTGMSIEAIIACVLLVVTSVPALFLVLRSKTLQDTISNAYTRTTRAVTRGEIRHMGYVSQTPDVRSLEYSSQGVETEDTRKRRQAFPELKKILVPLLLDHRRAEIATTEEVVKAAAAGTLINGKAIMARLLDRRGAEISITEEVVKAAAGNPFNGKEVVTLLLDQRGAEISITEEVVIAAAGNSSNGKEVITLLLDRRGAEILITEEVVKAAAGNWSKGEEIMARLLDRRGAEISITEEVVKAAAGNPFNGKEVMTLLLDQRGAEISITEEVVIAAAGNSSNGKEVITLLLDRRGADIPITEEVVKAAAGNWHNGKEWITLLLDRRGADIPVTEGVVKAAAGNNSTGKEIMALLLNQRGAEIIITEEVVKAAAANKGNGKEVITLLLDQRGAEISITEEVVKAAAGNQRNGKEVMTLLLDRRGAEIIITEEVVKAVAGNRYNGEEIMALLLDRRGAEIIITEEVVKTTAGNKSTGKKVMALLLGQRGTEISITEEVIKAAARNDFISKEVMTRLLDQRGTEMSATDEVAKVAARKWQSAIREEQAGTDTEEGIAGHMAIVPRVIQTSVSSDGPKVSTESLDAIPQIHFPPPRPNSTIVEESENVQTPPEHTPQPDPAIVERRRSDALLSFVSDVFFSLARHTYGALLEHLPDVGLRERAVLPGYHRVRWTNVSVSDFASLTSSREFRIITNVMQPEGKRLYDDYVELEPGAIEVLQRHLNTSAYRSHVNHQNHGAGRSPQNVNLEANSANGSDLFSRDITDQAQTSGFGSIESVLSRTDVEQGDKATRTLHLLSCMESGRYGVELHQELITHIMDDLQLFRTLRRSYQKHRGSLKSYWSLRTIQSIHFMKVRTYLLVCELTSNLLT